MLFQHRDDVERSVPESHGGRAIGGPAVSSDRQLELLVSKAGIVSLKAVEHGSERVRGRRQHRHRVNPGTFSAITSPVAIVDDAPRSRSGTSRRRFVYARKHVLRVLQDLRSEEGTQQQAEPHDEADGGHLGPACHIVGVEKLILVGDAPAGSSSGRIMTSRITPAAAVTAPDKGAQTKIS